MGERQEGEQERHASNDRLEAVRIGLISDTHGLIRPEAIAALRGVHLILHAGDVGGLAVIAALEQVAPVRAVSGNVDPPEHALPGRIDLDLDGLRIHVSHGHEISTPTAEKLLARYSADVVVFGHTHRAVIVNDGKRIAVNPGAAGPRRFDVKPSVAILEIAAGQPVVRIVWL
jgi:putative phosphoesterase